MPIYKYRAKKGPEDTKEGELEAQSEHDAIEKIHQMGYLPVRVKEFINSIQGTVSSKRMHSGKVKFKDVTIFSRQLASLLKSGVPILDALDIISEQTESGNFKSIIVDIHNSIKEGLEFSSALDKYPKIFSTLYIAILRTGEDSGSLDTSLLRVADYRIKQEEVFSRFRMALVYPVLMGIVGVATVIFMLVFVMPRLTGIFSSMGQNLPLPTQLLIVISEGLRRWWFWIAAILTAFVLTVARFVKTKSGKARMGLLQLHFPVFGKFILKAELARFSRTLELLLKSGIDVLSAIHVSMPVLDNEILKGLIDKSCKELEHGGSFGKSLKSSKLIPAFMSNLIIVGEESGRLREALAEVAASYERDTEEQMRVMFSLLEPLMILAIGLIVGFIVVAMLLPVFEINVMAG